MPPRVDFYVIARQVADGRLRAACRVCRKIHAVGERAYVQTTDSDQARLLDDLMWTYDQGSFVPHELHVPGRDSGYTPIAIGHCPPAGGGYTVLVSTLDTVPERYGEFARVVELVDNTPEDKNRARERYRWYQGQGCELHKHEINV